MQHVFNILIITTNTKSGRFNTELYPIAFSKLEEVEYELRCEGFTETNRSHEWTWAEDNIVKTALIRYTPVA